MPGERLEDPATARWVRPRDIPSRASEICWMAAKLSRCYHVLDTPRGGGAGLGPSEAGRQSELCPPVLGARPRRVMRLEFGRTPKTAVPLTVPPGSPLCSPPNIQVSPSAPRGRARRDPEPGGPALVGRLERQLRPQLLRGLAHRPHSAYRSAATRSRRARPGMVLLGVLSGRHAVMSVFAARSFERAARVGSVSSRRWPPRGPSS